MGHNKINFSNTFEPMANCSCLFDDVEKHIYGRLFEIKLFDGSTVLFASHEFTEYEGHDLDKLRNILGDSMFESILKYFDFKLKEKTISHYYKTEEHLALKFFQKNNLFFVFTFGEKQPSRWVLTLEAAWKISINE